MYDLVIIGGAAAGSAAAIYGARRNLNLIIVSKDAGGEVALSGEVNNWPGAIATNGFQLAQDFTNHVKSYNVPMDLGFEVTTITPEKNYYNVTAKNFSGQEKIYQTKTIIIASGIHPRLLGLPGEAELRGKGVTYCTVCDGPLYRGKTTATVGAGNAALESALMMGGIAQKVYLVTKYPNTPESKGGFPKGEDILVDKVKKLPNIEIIYNAESKEFVVEGMVTGLKYLDKTDNTEKTIAVQGVMVHVGNTPNSQFIDIKKDPGNQIEIDQKCRTSLPGIFAAGDVTNIPYKQIVVSAGQGVIAALSAIEYINKWKEE